MKLLVAVDDTKGTRAAIGTLVDYCKWMSPEAVVLLHVEKPEGRSLIDEMLSEPEMSTLREAMRGTKIQEMLDRKAEKIFAFYQGMLKEKGLTDIKTVVRSGHPAEEILQAAKDEKVDMIVIGSRGVRASHRFMGSVSREVADHAEVPVLLVKSPAQG